jgi:hypothetical protein
MKYITLDCHKQYDHGTMIDTGTGEIKNKKLVHIKGEYKEFIGIELVKDKTAREPLPSDDMGAILGDLLKQSVIIVPAGVITM